MSSHASDPLALKKSSLSASMASGILVILMLALTLAPSRATAHGGPPPWAGAGRPSAVAGQTGGDDFLALERFLSMSDAQLDALAKAIARVRAMSPAERAALRKQIADYAKLTPEQRNQVRNSWGWADERDRADWPTMMQSKTADERAAIQTELQQLPRERRATRKHELLEAWRKATGAR